MPKWRKASDRAVARFDALVPRDARVERRQMFGYPAAFLGGNLMISLFQDDLLLRLDEDSCRELLEEPEARTFEPMPGRPMKQYIVAPPSLVEDDAAIRRWIARAMAYVATLPPKGKKPSKKPAATKRASK